jgi:hypothetical protein
LSHLDIEGYSFLGLGFYPSASYAAGDMRCVAARWSADVTTVLSARERPAPVAVIAEMVMSNLLQYIFIFLVMS